MKHTDTTHKCVVVRTYDLVLKREFWSVGCRGCSTDGRDMGDVGSFEFNREGWEMAVKVGKAHAWLAYL